MNATFEPIAPSPSCDFCSGRKRSAELDIDAAYCLSLVEQPHRVAHATKHFHEIGLCQYVTFRRAHLDTSRQGLAIWESHRDIARDALVKGHKRVLIMEDDVEFRQPIARLAPRVARALKSMPKDWWVLYLGHVPVQAYFIAWGLLRARSGGLHAYIANTPMLQWYVATTPRSVEVPMWPMLSPGVDAATSLLPRMYAVFPMAAFQKDLGDRRIDSRRTSGGHRRAFLDFDRFRYLVLFHGMRFAEVAAALASPFHWLTMEWFIRRIGRAAKGAQAIRKAGLFDDQFYLNAYPDIATAKVDPFAHYMQYGCREGRWPNASFDPNFYSQQAPTLQPGENPLLHYIAVGRNLGYLTHPQASQIA